MELVENNLNLVHEIIHKYFDGYRNVIEYEDMFQIGSLALVKASQNFKKEYNIKFSTYACKSIHREIIKSLNKEIYGVYNYQKETQIKKISLNNKMHFKDSEVEFLEMFGEESECSAIELKVTLNTFKSLLDEFKLITWELSLRGYNSPKISEILNSKGYDVSYWKIAFTVRQLRKCFKDFIEGKEVKLPRERRGRNGIKSRR